MDYPITQAIRFLRQRKVDFVPHLYDYEEKGGTSQSARCLSVDEHVVIKTLVFETNDMKPIVVLQHGDLEVSAKKMARYLGAKSVSPATPERANKFTGYIFGGTSPFGLKSRIPIYAEESIFKLEKIYINGGGRGFLIEISSSVLSDVLDIEPITVGI